MSNTNANATEQPVLTSIPFFDKLVAETEDDSKQRKAVRAGRSLERKLQAAYDNARDQADVLEDRLEDMHDAIGKDPARGVAAFDVNVLVSLKANVAELETAKEVLAVEYKHLFGKEIS